MQGKNHVFKIEYDEEPYAEQLSRLAGLLATLDTVVLFNAKFDLNWLARYGVFLPTSCRVFDCQLAEFILDYQRNPYPSLDGCLSKYSLGAKLDVVATEYWSKGIDTDKVPLDVLTPYLCTDLERTEALYLTIRPLVEERGLSRLVSLHMQDLRVLQEMEYHGIAMDWTKLELQARATEKEIKGLDATILAYVPLDAREHFNGASGDHLSALLYGGCISIDVGTPYQHTYKAGLRAGTTETRYKWETREFQYPRLVDPPEGSELKKEGFFSVDAETLLQLKKPKDLVAALLKRSELEKLLGTYLKGIQDLCQKYDWQDGKIHGTFNQCRVVTGRLSSEKPNLQNFPDPMMQFIISRF